MVVFLRPLRQKNYMYVPTFVDDMFKQTKIKILSLHKNGHCGVRTLETAIETHTILGGRTFYLQHQPGWEYLQSLQPHCFSLAVAMGETSNWLYTYTLLYLLYFILTLDLNNQLIFRWTLLYVSNSNRNHWEKHLQWYFHWSGALLSPVQDPVTSHISWLPVQSATEIST